MNKGERIDVLIVCPDYLSDAIKYEEIIETIILLSPDRLSDGCCDLDWIYKYMDGNMLAESIIDIYLKKNSKGVNITGDERKHNIVTSIYSPAGGVGKTTISLALSIVSAKRGLRTLYLSLEHIQTTQLFFDCSKEKTLSDVILLLRQDNKKLLQMVESAINIDERYNLLNYFCPTECALDMDTITPQEIKQLINKLRESARYDMIFVDMSSELNHKNISAMRSSDKIVLVVSPEIFSIAKHKSLLEELERLRGDETFHIMNNSLCVMNRYESRKEQYIQDKALEGASPCIRLPETNNIAINQNGKYIININSDFGNSINALLNSILRGERSC